MSETEFRETDHADCVVQRVAQAHDAIVKFSGTNASFIDHYGEAFETIPRLENGLFSGDDILVALGY